MEHMTQRDKSYNQYSILRCGMLLYFMWKEDNIWPHKGDRNRPNAHARDHESRVYNLWDLPLRSPLWHKSPLGSSPRLSPGGLYFVYNHGNHRNAEQDAARVKIISSFKSRTFNMFTLAVNCLGQTIVKTYFRYRLENRTPSPCALCGLGGRWPVSRSSPTPSSDHRIRDHALTPGTGKRNRVARKGNKRAKKGTLNYFKGFRARRRGALSENNFLTRFVLPISGPVNHNTSVTSVVALGPLHKDGDATLEKSTG